MFVYLQKLLLKIYSNIRVWLTCVCGRGSAVEEGHLWEWLGMYIWLSLVGLKLGEGTNIRETASCYSSPSHMSQLLQKIAVWLPPSLTCSGLASWPSNAEKRLMSLAGRHELSVRVVFTYLVWPLSVGVFSLSSTWHRVSA